MRNAVVSPVSLSIRRHLLLIVCRAILQPAKMIVGAFGGSRGDFAGINSKAIAARDMSAALGGEIRAQGVAKPGRDDTSVELTVNGQLQRM